MASNTALPKWVWDLTIAMLNHEDEHSADKTCLNAVVSAIPVDARDYTFTGVDGKSVVALAPIASVRSVIRQDAEPKSDVSYPHQDGDVTVLGPEVFASTDGGVISWKGSNYSRRTGPMLGKVTG